MKQVKIIAISEKGKSALRQHIRDIKKLPLHMKMQYKALYKEKIIKEPLTLILECKSKLLAESMNNEAIKKPIRAAMNEKKVYENYDYKLEVE